MLVAKKERMEHLIASIDDILKGENKMDFAIFSKTEVEEMFQTMFEHMPDNMKELAVKSLEALKNGKSIILRQFHQKKCRKAMLKLLSGMEEKSNSCLLPTILLARGCRKLQPTI